MPSVRPWGAAINGQKMPQTGFQELQLDPVLDRSLLGNLFLNNLAADEAR
jgi:hypothetical protein